MEIWKKYNEEYEVSTFGNVRRIDGNEPKIGLTKGGYLYVYRYDQTIHRMVVETFIGKIPKGMVVNHIDHNKLNNHVTNLEITTYSYNTKEAYRLGFANGKKGQENSMAKVLETDVLEMYDLFRLGYSNSEVADLYGLHDRYISLIRHGKRWNYLYKQKVDTPFCKSYTYKVSRSAILTAHKLLTEGYSNLDVSKATGIEKSMISRLKTGKCYADFISDFHKLATTIESVGNH